MMPKSTAPIGQKFASSPRKYQDDDAEEQRKRNIHADDDGTAQVAEENPLDQENQQTTENQVVQDRTRGDRTRAPRS